MPSKIDLIDAIQIADPTGTNVTTPKMIVGCGGNIYWGGWGSWTHTGAGSYDASAAEITTVGASQNFYLVDGTSLVKITGAAGTVSTITTGGTAQPPTGARIVTLYRNRLVLARTSTDPQDWFMSKVGNYTNFDYTNQDDGVSVAVAGNNSTAGTVGDVITALIPFNDDFMVMGCSDSVWVMRGDPAAGGRIDNLSWGGGIVGPQAWARDREGHIYYLSHTDLMMLTPGTLPVSISNSRLQKFLADIDFSSYSIRLAWDPVNVGLWVFFTKATSQAVVHLFWDQRMDGFTTHQFPNDHGPTAVKSLVGLVAQDRQTLMGGFDGIIRTFDPAWTTDDGTAIDAYVKFPPLMLGEPGQRGVLSETELVIGNLDNPDATFEWFVGDNAQMAITAMVAAASVETTDTGRFLWRAKARGQAAVLKVSNSVIAQTFAFESGHILAYPAGRTR